MWTFHGHILMQNCIHLCVSLHADMHQYQAKPGSSVSSPVEEQTRGKQNLFLCMLYLCLVQLPKQIALRKYITMQAQKQNYQYCRYNSAIRQLSVTTPTDNSTIENWPHSWSTFSFILLVTFRGLYRCNGAITYEVLITAIWGCDSLIVIVWVFCLLIENPYSQIGWCIYKHSCLFVDSFLIWADSENYQSIIFIMVMLIMVTWKHTLIK